MKQFNLISILVFLVSFFSYGQVTIYSDCYYRGKSANLSPGNYYNSAQFSVADRSISSIKIPPGYRVELYTGINMSGGRSVFTSNNACMASYMNNLVRSIRITYNFDSQGDNFNPYGGVSVYTECNYRGHYAYLPPGDYPRLKSIIGNDAISSIRVPNGMVIELYKDDKFRGGSTGKITSDNNCLGNYWNNTASSARVSYKSGGWMPPPVKPPVTNNRSITIYAGCNYFGDAQQFNEGNFANLKPALNNRPAGSMMIPAGLTVELYSLPNFSGNLIGKYTANKPCLQSSIQYGASSMRVYRSGGSGGGGSSASGGVTIYASCNFSGRSSKLSAGRYNNLNQNGNFSPSSFRVPPGYEITLFLQPNMQGNSTGKITSDINCLGDWIKLKARSAIVTRKQIPPPTPR